MNTQYVNDRLQAVEDSLKRAEAASSGDLDLGAALSSFLVVLACGVYEDCIEHMFGVRAATAQDAKLQAYVKSSLDRLFRNPTFTEVADVLERFDKDDARVFRSRVSLAAKESLNSIVLNKNLVAHRGQFANVTLRDVRSFIGTANEVLKELEAMLGL